MDFVKTIIPGGMYALADYYYSMSSTDPSTWGAWIAVGRGSIDWTKYEVPTAPSTQTLLFDEFIRVEPMWAGYLNETQYDLGEIQYSDTQTLILRFVAEFPSDSLTCCGLTSVYLREYGLFIDGIHVLNSGKMCLLVNQSRMWWENGVRLRKEIILDLRGE